MSRRLVALLVAVGLVLGTTLPAIGKGVGEVTITGPGSEQPIVLEPTSPETQREIDTLLEAVGFWALAWRSDVADHLARITDDPPTDELGPEYVVATTQFVPEGGVTIDALVYPRASGGPLVYIAPGMEVAPLGKVDGGWFAPTEDLGLILTRYGFDVTKTDSATTPRDGRAHPNAAWLLPLGLIVALAGWAVGRRPRRLSVS